MDASEPGTPASTIFAHSLPDRPIEDWEPLSHHLAVVGDRAAEFAEAFGWKEAARVAGRLHDIGKCSAAFQAYIRRARQGDERTQGPDHSTAGARAAAEAYGALGRMLAFAIAGHHSGLADFADLERRLKPEHAIEPYPEWQAHAGAPPPLAALRNTRSFSKSTDKGFEQAFLTRMLFSCLVDADFLETERFYAEAKGAPVERGGHLDLDTLRQSLRTYMGQLRAEADPTPLNALRAEVLDKAVERAVSSPGLFTLTVPTGGGKTLASLSFALEHAVRHGLRRVVYVIPFTSIIEQTAQVFRKALNTRDDVLEHHASFDWERAEEARRDDGEGADGLAKLRRAAENWDVPIVVATAVQFFESLFAARTSRCRKLHNLAGSVIVLDEAQTLPLPLLRPCMAALQELTANYNTSVVLCTATQPALRQQDGFEHGFPIDHTRELAPEPKALYARLKRVKVEHPTGPVTDETIAARFAEQPQQQMLCIVNSRAHARALFEAIRELPGAAHLTTLMCPRHRRIELAKLRGRLKRKGPVRLVATSLIEAGVDIDFPEVWRAAAGLDSIAQAAGRCNREGQAALGRTVVFEPAEAKPPAALKAFWQTARPVLRRHDDPLTLDAIWDYFRELYWQKGEMAFDTVPIDGRPGILPAIAERATDARFPFASIAAAFRMIDDIMEPVVVPWRSDAEDHDAESVLNRIAAMDRPLARDLRQLQQYTVPIPPRARREWLAAGVLRPVHPALGAALLRFEDLAHYEPMTGVQLDPDLRSPEANIIA
ncbi:MAG: CRISPR-associated endonuclease Cas3'' [Stellaceae bacterium]